MFKTKVQQKFLNQFEAAQDGGSSDHSYSSNLMICKFSKWNMRKVYEAEITENVIAKLLENDLKIQGLPKFISDFLNLKPSRHREALAHRPELYPWSPCGQYLLMPNPAYTKHEQLLEDPKKARTDKEGFGLVAWFIHPTLLAESRYPERVRILNALQESKESLRYGKYGSKDNLKNSIFRVDSFSDLSVRDQEKVPTGELVKQSGIPYPSGPFDYTPEHIPSLIALRDFARQHLKEIYGVTDCDRVDIYFHTHYGIETTTAHLHVRVNQLHHGLELSRSVFLDDIIDCLSQGKRVIDSFIEREYVHFGPNAYVLLNKLGYNLREVDNPFLVECSSSEDNSGKLTYRLKG